MNVGMQHCLCSSYSSLKLMQHNYIYLISYLSWKCIALWDGVAYTCCIWDMMNVYLWRFDRLKK